MYSSEYASDFSRPAVAQLPAPPLPRDERQCRTGSWQVAENSVGTQGISLVCMSGTTRRIAERDSLDERDGLIWFIWFVLFIWFVSFNQTNQTDQINKGNKLVLALHAAQSVAAGGLFQHPVLKAWN